MLKLSRLLWVVLLVCAFLVLGDDRADAKEVLASWYGPGFEGSPTASGEPYEPYGYTAAHKTMPLGTNLVVSYGGRSLQVTVNDRGPYVGSRELDLSQGAAEYLGLTQAGVDYVKYHRAGGGYGRGHGGGYGRGYGRGYGGGYDAGYSGYSETDYSTYSSGAQPGSSGGTYVVQSGDTLSGIAAQLGTTVEDLAAANGIADPDLLYAGQTLYY
jgi:rare lipoprotein A